MTDPMPGAKPRDLLIRPLTPAEIAAARRTVASNAHDPADCRRLLDLLGLL